MAATPEQTLATLRVALAETRQVALRQGIWPEGLRQKTVMANLFEQSAVYDPAGNIVRLPAASRKHYLWKLANGLDRRRFHMTNTLQRSLHAPQSFVRTSDGFSIIPTRANFQAVVPGKIGLPGQRSRKPRATFLNRYFRFINARAAFRIGKLGAKQIARVRASGMAAIDGHLKLNLRQAIKIKGGIRTVNLTLDKMGLERV